MLSVTYFNCLKASNLMNISLEDIKNIKKHTEIENAWVIYGTKIIILDDILYEQVQTYIKLFRPLITADEKLQDARRFLFTSSRITTSKPLGIQMNHSATANALSSSFKKAKVGIVTILLSLLADSILKHEIGL